MKDKPLVGVLADPCICFSFKVNGFEALAIIPENIYREGDLPDFSAIYADGYWCYLLEVEYGEEDFVDSLAKRYSGKRIAIHTDINCIDYSEKHIKRYKELKERWEQHENIRIFDDKDWPDGRLDEVVRYLKGEDIEGINKS